MLLVILLYALFATIFVIAKEGLQVCGPFFLVGSRMLMASALLFAYLVFWRKSESVKLNKTTLRLTLLLGLFNIYMTNAFEFWGLQYLSPAKTCFIYSLSPFLSALFSYLIFSERLTPKKWLGLVVGFVGFIPILLNQGRGEELSGQVSFLSWAEISVLIAAASTVYGWIVMRRLVQDEGMSAVGANAWSMLFGGVMALANSLMVEEWNPLPVTDYETYFYTTALMIVISSLICYNLYGHLLKEFTATFLSFAGFMTPLFTALFEWLWFGQVVSLGFVLSALIVLAALLLFYQEELKKEGIHREEVTA